MVYQTPKLANIFEPGGKPSKEDTSLAKATPKGYLYDSSRMKSRMTSVFTFFYTNKQGKSSTPLVLLVGTKGGGGHYIKSVGKPASLHYTGLNLYTLGSFTKNYLISKFGQAAPSWDEVKRIGYITKTGFRMYKTNNMNDIKPVNTVAYLDAEGWEHDGEGVL
tara:strand:- start:15 stop:503 length:489 start_codon:yes stop_codon:yes gene_type:complete